MSGREPVEEPFFSRVCPNGPPSGVGHYHAGRRPVHPVSEYFVHGLLLVRLPVPLRLGPVVNVVTK